MLLTLFTGSVWLLNKLWLAPRRRQIHAETEAEPKPSALVEFCLSFFPVILIVLLLRSFVVEPFRIPSGSMLPTLHIGDFILVNKFTYGIRLPVTHHMILPLNEPERGDVIVFRHPPDPSRDYIKRVIGLPGDEISYENRELFINGEKVRTIPDGRYDGPGIPVLLKSQQFLEDLGETQHHILHLPERPQLRGRKWTIKPGHYFVMGDNRDNSEDSRVWGLVPEDHLVGKAFFVWMSWDVEKSRPDVSRIGMTIE